MASPLQEPERFSVTFARFLQTESADETQILAVAICAATSAAV
jgi:hypothetical protein